MVNRVRSSLELKLSDVQEQLGQQVSIVITPEPELAYQSSLQKTPLTLLRPESLVAQQFHALVGNLIPNP
jgi:hypothetical protein